MGGLKKYYFGKSKYKPNTFIGGVSATMNTPALVASKLGVPVASIKVFSVVGSNIQFHVKSGYNLPQNMFYNNAEASSITYYDDREGKAFTNTNTSQFRNCPNLTYINLPNFTSATYGNRFFIHTLATLTELRLDNVKGLYQTNFVINVPLMTTFYCPLVERIEWASIGGMSSLAVLDVKKCKFFSDDAGSSSSRPITTSGFKTGMVININVFLATSNAGAPNGHLVYYKATFGAVVNFYDDSGNYVSTL